MLMEEAERIARTHGYRKLAVISGVGVRRYYERLGFVKTANFQVKTLPRLILGVTWSRCLLAGAAAVATVGVVATVLRRRHK